jgi:phage gp45-like
MSFRDSKDFAKQTAADYRSFRGALRRLIVTLADGARWQLLGRSVSDDKETINAEVFGNIGFHSRPRTSGGSPEAIMVSLGGNGSPVVVATRDEQTRATVAGTIAADETAVFNSTAIIVVKANGTVEIRSANGSAVPLATKADIDALRTWASNHTHLYAPGPGTAVATATGLPVPPNAVGTLVLKGA